jgi:two-component system, cell cycle response regulator DivK
MRTVLVVEDNQDNLKIVTYALQREGYTVIAAESGEEGLELALKERPLFILKDINLPGMDGLETTKRIRLSDADGGIPILAITSYAMSGRPGANPGSRLQRLFRKTDRPENHRRPDSYDSMKDGKMKRALLPLMEPVREYK